MITTELISQQQDKNKLLDGWRWVRLKDVCLKITDGTHHSPPNGSEGIPYITAKNIRPFRLDLTELTYVSPKDHREIYKRCDPKPGDVLYIKDGVTMGIAAVNRLEYEFSMLSSVALLRPNPELLESDFLAVCLNAPDTFRSVTANQSGSAIRRVVLKQIEEIKIPLPPLDEQKRIVAILNEQRAAVERARQATLAQLEAAQALPAAYLRTAFNSPEAQKWERKRLGNVCEILGGMQPPKSTFSYKPLPGYVRLIQIQDFRKDDVAVYIPEEEAKRTFDESDVMIGRYGPPVFQILRGLSGAYNVALMKTIPKLNLLKDYLYYLLQENSIQSAVIEQSQRTAGQSGVQKDFLENFLVVVPPLSDQKLIVATINEQMAEVKRLKQSLEFQLDAINKLPATLLHRAFQEKI